MYQQIGTKSADFFVCIGCGVYVGAVYSEGGSCWCVLNINTLSTRASFTQTVTELNTDGTDAQQRIERWKQVWTPTQIVLQTPNESSMLQ